MNNLFFGKLKSGTDINPSESDRMYSDWGLIGGQSNIAGRNDIAEIPEGYGIEYTNVKVWANGIIKNLDITNEAFSGSDKGGVYAWDTLLLKDLADYYGTTLKVAKWAIGGTNCGGKGSDYYLNNHEPFASWHPTVIGGLYNALYNKVKSIQQYEWINFRKIARFRFVLFDLKECDSDDLTWSQEYGYYADGQLQGNFVDFMTALRASTGNPNLPFICAQMMSSQIDPYRANTAACQLVIDNYDTNFYLLKMNENTAYYPLQDNWHYSHTGTRHVADGMFDIIVNNNLIANFRS